MDFEYINKDGCWESVSAHGDVSVMNVAEVVSKLNFFIILMDESAIHGKKKEGGYILSWQGAKFIKGGNPSYSTAKPA